MAAEWSGADASGTYAGVKYKTWRRYHGTDTAVYLLVRHLEEVADFISTGSFSVADKSHDKDSLQGYLKELEKHLEEQRAVAGAATGQQTTFIRAVPTRPGEEGP